MGTCRGLTRPKKGRVHEYSWQPRTATRGPKFLTVGGTYVADLALPGSVHVTFVRSSMAHARIVSVDSTYAQAMPGVLAVYTDDDLGLPKFRPSWA